MRATMHNGRRNKDGKAYTSKHNDRNFDVRTAEHIDESRSSSNIYWQLYEDGATFEEAEERFYQEHFTDNLNAQNERYRQQRHEERCKTMKEYQEQNCPVETIWQLGTAKENPGKEVLQELMNDILEWQQAVYPQCVIVDYAYHNDEATPHLHVRSVFIGHDKDGNEKASQSAALKEMGVERPDMSKPQSRYNSPIMAFTKDLRETFIAAAKAKGLDIEEQPKESSKTRLNKLEYQTKCEQEKADELARQLEVLTRQLSATQAQLNKAQEELEEAQRHSDTLNSENEHIRAENELLRQEVERLKDEKIKGTLLKKEKPTYNDYMALKEQAAASEEKARNEEKKNQQYKQQLKETSTERKAGEERIRQLEAAVARQQREKEALTEFISTQLNIGVTELNAAMSRYMSSSMNISFTEYVKDGIRQRQSAARDREHEHNHHRVR